VKPGASLASCGLGQMRADATPFVVGQIRRVSSALHGAERRPPPRSLSTFQTVSGRRILRSSRVQSSRKLARRGFELAALGEQRCSLGGIMPVGMVSPSRTGEMRRTDETINHH